MNSGEMCRAVGRGALIVGLMMQSTPIAWAQLADIDPVLHAGVEALVTSDPEVAGNPELAQLCRDIAEAVVLDPRERAAVTQEAAILEREGIDVSTVIPTEVRETARARFNEMQSRMQAEADTLRASDPERAKGIELMMREGERQMLAFESGERYVPSTEMIAHAESMFKDWESGMLAQGAPPEFVERARMELARYSSGEGMMVGGPGHEFAGPGPGGGMPSIEQMQAMGMTPEQIQMAQAHPEGMSTGRTYAEMMAGNAVYGTTDWSAGGGSNYGINPATGGWEPGMGGGAQSAYMPEGWARDQTGSFHYVGSEGTYGGGTAYSSDAYYGGSSSWEAVAGGWTNTGTGETWTMDNSGGWVSSSGETHPMSTTTDWSSSSTELRQDVQTNTTTAAQERYETATHVHGDDTNHEHTIHVHTDATRHDHTATSPADTAPGAVYIP